jgi:tRNA N6-adenosine threonylcarbamoyltransferase
MVILGIETSCDETSVAVIEGKENVTELKANVVASSLDLHAKTGGIIPEVASRAQFKFMIPVLEEAIKKAFDLKKEKINTSPPPIDAVAVTYGPGLIGPLLIGVETARALSYVWKKTLIPVNHMMGHIYANFVGKISNLKSQISNIKLPEFPLVALVVSGGHTDLIYMRKHGDVEVLGGTRDDAAGEAFDKIGRLIGLEYPAGPVIEKRAMDGDVGRFSFPRPLLDKRNYDFSFSGLKTAVLKEVRGIGELDAQTVNDVAAGTQAAVVDVLVKKTMRAVEEKNVKSILLSGGVAANEKLREVFQKEILKLGGDVKLIYPPKNLCTDNAAMIATAAYFNYKPVEWGDLQADPELYYD